MLPNRDPAGPVLRAPKTAELIASYIRGQIVRRDLKTGDALPSETVLMEMFGVSRPTLREVVAMHLSTVVMRTFDHPGTQDQFRKLVRSYRKLVLLIEAGDAEGAERHWRTHMEVVGRKLLRGDMAAKAVVDLFG